MVTTGGKERGINFIARNYWRSVFARCCFYLPCETAFAPCRIICRIRAFFLPTIRSHDFISERTLAGAEGAGTTGTRSRGGRDAAFPRVYYPRWFRPYKGRIGRIARSSKIRVLFLPKSRAAMLIETSKRFAPPIKNNCSRNRFSPHLPSRSEVFF